MGPVYPARQSGIRFFIPGIVIPHEAEASDLRPIIVSTTSVEGF
jgi:hypothetical protein